MTKARMKRIVATYCVACIARFYSMDIKLPVGLCHTCDAVNEPELITNRELSDFELDVKTIIVNKYSRN